MSDNGKQALHAKQFTDSGIHIFPQSRDKKPLIKDWPNTATIEPDQLNTWSKQFPKSVWAALCGELSGIFVIDIDVKNGQPGMQSWSKFVDGRDGWKDTLSVRTPSGGHHIYYTWDDSLDFTKIPDLLPGVEVIGNRQCATLPGSYMGNGKEYVASSKNLPIGPAPEWLLQKIRDHKATPKTKAPATGEIPDGERNATLFRLASRYRALGLSRDAIVEKLRIDNVQRCAQPLPDSEIGNLADSVSRYDAGNALRFTDLSNASLFSEKHRGRILFCHPHQSWYAWDSTRWTKDDEGLVFSLAKAMVRDFMKEAANIVDDEERRRVAKGALSCESRNKITSFVQLAQSDCPIKPDAFDTEDMLFNSAGGVLDLQAGKLLPHSPELLLTKISPVMYDKAAEAPAWEQHLSTCFQDDLELIRYFQKLCGYTLSGSTEEQIFIFVYGGGANGKSVTLDVIEHVLGDYATRTSAETFLDQRNSDHSTVVHALRGARMILAQEISKGRKWNEGRLKELSGERTVSARAMRADPENVRINGKIWISANHKPNVDDASEAFWRRIKLLPFEYRIPDEDQDKRIKDKLVAEAPGILNWMLRGYKAWRDEGLTEPNQVKSATNAYRSDSDIFREFIDEHIDEQRGARIGAKDLHDRYFKWTSENHMKPYGAKRFSQEMQEHGYTKARTKKGVLWLDICLRFDNDKGQELDGV